MCLPLAHIYAINVRLDWYFFWEHNSERTHASTSSFEAAIEFFYFGLICNSVTKWSFIEISIYLCAWLKNINQTWSEINFCWFLLLLHLLAGRLWWCGDPISIEPAHTLLFDCAHHGHGMFKWVLLILASRKCWWKNIFKRVRRILSSEEVQKKYRNGRGHKITIKIIYKIEIKYKNRNKTSSS